MEPKDTLPPASKETPGQPPVVQNGDDPSNIPASKETPVKKLAGKYDTPEELESAYLSAQSKLGSKSYAEKIGQKVLETTGHTVDELKEAGYDADQIAEMIVQSASADAPKDDDDAKKPKLPNKDEIKTKVENSRAEKLEWKVDLSDFLAEMPEAKEFKDEITEFHSMPQYKGMTPAEIFAQKISKFVQKGEASLAARHNDKERANMDGLNHSQPPEKPTSAKALEQFRANPGRFQNAEAFVAARLAEKRTGK